MKIISTNHTFFEYLGLFTFGTVIGNYLLDLPLLNIVVFILYCFLSALLSGANIFLNLRELWKRPKL